ncbi:HET-domain-containing protein [Acephala macrosclerotiorum]|nr:HET-domain-containing protein [Acephala macrosclerotiorum]
MATTAELCSKCRSIFTTQIRENRGREIPHHEHTHDIVDASKSGCRICGFLLSRFSIQVNQSLLTPAVNEPNRSGTSNVFFRVWDSILEPYDSVVCDFFFRKSDATVENSSLRFDRVEGDFVKDTKLIEMTYNDPARDSAAIIVCQSSAPYSCGITNTGSIASLQRARTWIDKCIHTHSICQREGPTKGNLPSRLLKVDPVKKTFLRLYDTRKLPRGTQYITLSHMWGTKKFLTLTTQNLENLRAGISITDLTKTFQDAIAITQFMGIGYIWIDSLCIIQDSTDDWERESVLMRDVYANSYCNIAATHAYDGQMGCFVDRREMDISTLTIDVLQKKQSRNAMFKSGRYKCRDLNLWWKEVTNSPLLKRGWVCQERLLAPRILHFASTRIFFECQENLACEGYDDWRSLGSFETDGWKIEVHSYLEEAQSIRGHCHRAVARRRILARAAWRTMVNNYSQCELTRESDILVAISGLATLLQPLMSCQYFAGIWGDPLVYQLLWSNATYRISTESYQAPSWSWASKPGGVFLRDEDTIIAREQQVIGAKASIKSQSMELVKVCGVEVVTVNGNPMSQVTHGWLRLKGKLIPMEEWDTKVWDSLTTEVKVRGIDFDLILDNYLKISSKHFDPVPRFVYVLLAHFKEVPKIQDELSGLLLAATGKAKGQYRRVGFIQYCRYNDPAGWLYMPFERSEEEREQMTDDLYESYDEETDSYTFTII